MNPHLLHTKPAVDGNMGDWQTRHMSAVNCPKGFEIAVAHGIDAWITYAYMHEVRYESKIGSDYVLGEHWKDWGLALRGLLNGDCGRLDCGTLDHVILETMKQCGIADTDTL